MLRAIHQGAKSVIDNCTSHFYSYDLEPLEGPCGVPCELKIHIRYVMR